MKPSSLIVVVSILLLLGGTGCEEKIKPSVLSGLEGSELPKQESWNSTIVISDSGRVKAVIQAGYLRSYSSPPRTLLQENIVVHFYDEFGVETSALRAREATVDDATKDLEASGNVVVVSSDSTVLRTQKLFWDNRRQLIHTPEFVRIESPRERLQGFGFESDQHLRNYRIFRVSGEAITR